MLIVGVAECGIAYIVKNVKNAERKCKSPNDTNVPWRERNN